MPGKVYKAHRQRFLPQQGSWERNTYCQGQRSSAFGVDEEQSGNRRHHLDGTIAQRCIQGLSRGIADIFEDGRAVEGDD